MRYTIEYQSYNVYQHPVKEAIFEFRVLPCNDETQAVTTYSLINSIGEPVFSFKNLFGFEVNRIRTVAGFKEFTFRLNAVVQKNESELFPYSVLSPEEEQTELTAKAFYIDYHLYLLQSYYTILAPENREHVLEFDRSQPLSTYLQLLNGYVHSMLSYQKDTTDVKTTANEALNIRSGVCQDFVHLFIAMARYKGIPARYVSGYLNQGKSFIGSALMHAWVEAFIPGVGWKGFDPTNNLLVDTNYIKVSHGADYADCSPIKGVLKTKGDNTTSYRVKVSSQQQQQQ